MSFSLADLSAVTTNPDTAAIVSTANLAPVAGEGSRILPATYAASGDTDRKNGHSNPQGPAFSYDVPYLTSDRATPGVHLKLDKQGDPRRTDSVVVDSIGSAATRQENALWALRDTLDLPGIVLVDSEDADIDADLAAAWAAIDGKKGKATIPDEIKEAFNTRIRQEMVLGSDNSSWTLAHRHVDGAIRHGLDPARGTSVWEPTDDPVSLYQRIITAGGANLADLLNLSPNSVLYGYWLSSSAPVRHKLARAITTETTGYGAARANYGATRSQPWPADNTLRTSSASEMQVMDPKGSDPVWKKPAELGLSTIPSWNNNTVNCESILSTSQVSLNHLRRTLTASDVYTGNPHSKEAVEAVVTALTALGLLGRALTTENGFLRSGCDLIDDGLVYSAVSRRGDSLLDIPDTSAELLPVAVEALDAARDHGLLLGERTTVELSSRVRQIFLGSYINSALGKLDNDNDADVATDADD